MLITFRTPITLVFVYTVQAYVQVDLQAWTFKAVDPILKPGVSDPKVLHLHMFGGSDVLKTAVTPEDLEESSCTSAENPNDGSVYWTASLINKHTGAALRPIRWAAYYIGIDENTIPLPKGLRMITGDANNQVASGVDTNGAAPHWQCQNYKGKGSGLALDKRDAEPEPYPSENVQEAGKASADFPSTVCKGVLNLLLYYPNCLSKTDKTKYTFGKGGVASKAGGCPAGYDQIPQLRMSIRWNTGDLIPKNDLVLSSGNEYSIHGDVIFNWNAEAAQNMLKATAPPSTHNVQEVEGPIKTSCKPKDRQPTVGAKCYTGPPAGLAKRSLEEPPRTPLYRRSPKTHKHKEKSGKHKSKGHKSSKSKSGHGSNVSVPEKPGSDDSGTSGSNTDPGAGFSAPGDEQLPEQHSGPSANPLCRGPVMADL